MKEQPGREVGGAAIFDLDPPLPRVLSTQIHCGFKMQTVLYYMYTV